MSFLQDIDLVDNFIAAPNNAIETVKAQRYTI